MYYLISHWYVSGFQQVNFASFLSSFEVIIEELFKDQVLVQLYLLSWKVISNLYMSLIFCSSMPWHKVTCTWKNSCWNLHRIWQYT